jgi:hypothetical protein
LHEWNLNSVFRTQGNKFCFENFPRDYAELFCVYQHYDPSSPRPGLPIYLLTGITALVLNPMTLTNAPPGSGLFVLLALVLTVATI